MLFNSFEFLVFLPLVFILYWFGFSKNLRLQNLLLLTASYLFYGWWDWRFLGLIAFSSLVDFWAGKQIGRQQVEINRKIFLWISICVNLGFLGIFKYFNFFSVSLANAAQTLGLSIDPITLQVVLPVGISFYTFQTMSYTIDVYRRNMEPTDDIISFFAYVSFFPQLVAGPIERASNLLPQFEKSRNFSYNQAVDGLRLILWGLFKKVVIADNCAIFVNQIFDSYQNATGLELILGSVLFAFQIYGDFSGYSDIALGCAKLLGFELMINFRTPYFSRDIGEFWRRWHISLSTWFRDYVYIPLGGSKRGKGRVAFNVFVIFTLSGFWHGANWTFLVWGALNAIYFLPLILLGVNRSHLDTVAGNTIIPSARESLQIISTFSLTCLAWIFFRSKTVIDACAYIGKIFNGSFALDLKVNYLLTGLILFWLAMEWLGRREGVCEYIKSVNRGARRYALYYVLTICVLWYGVNEGTQFIYFQF